MSYDKTKPFGNLGTNKNQSNSEMEPLITIVANVLKAYQPDGSPGSYEQVAKLCIQALSNSGYGFVEPPRGMRF